MTEHYRQPGDIVRRQIQPYLDSEKAVGLGVGVFAGGSQCMVFGGGAAADRATPPDENTVFEIGSITKVFTTTLLADMHVAGALNLDDRVNRYLPPHGRLVCRGGDKVTLRHLATHTSGLPRLPKNLTWKAIASDNPYGNYSVDDLYAGLARCRLKNRPSTNTRYSNLGSGLLGHVLSLVGAADYERLVSDRILKPLEMRDTAIRLSDEQQRRLAPGHAEGKPVRNWDFQALVGAGALRSTVADMLRFLRANIDPASTPIHETLELSHQIQTQFTWKWYRDFGCMGPLALVGLGGLLAWRSFGLPLWLRFVIPMAIPAAMFTAWRTGVIGSIDDMALGWHFDRLDKEDTNAIDWALWHNGGTAGCASYLIFSKQHRTGVVLLANSDHEPDATGHAILLELLNQPHQSTHSVVLPASDRKISAGT